jgi:hypothetical protein
VNDEFEAPSYHLKNIQDVLEVFSTRIPEREDVWSPVLVEVKILLHIPFFVRLCENKHFSLK